MLCASVARAQDAPAAPQDFDTPAHISLVDGTAVLEREGRTEAAPTSMPLLGGDRLRTQAGRVEVLFADGSTLHLDANTSLDFQSDELVRLLDGRVRLMVAGPSREVSYRVDAPAAWVHIKEPGDYRISIVRAERGPEVELAVLRGAADLVNENGRSGLRAGERAFAHAAAAPSAPYVVNSAAWDAFDRWSEERRDQRLGASSQYLPSDVRQYSSTFDQYGSWQHQPAYGYVWYPRVAVGWRPYHHGRWASLRPYGWTWIGHDPWGWPTHHYGRWGFSAGAWFWIPGHRWGPAWVAWAHSPRYWGWCPLGWGNRPVFSFNVNFFGGKHYPVWHGWTAVERHHFHNRRYVNVNLLAPSRMGDRVRTTFVTATRGPAVTYAVPRGSLATTPIRSVGFRRPPGTSGPVTLSGANAADRRLPAPARAPRDLGPLTNRGEMPRAEAPAGVRAVPRSAPSPRSGDQRSSARFSRTNDAPGAIATAPAAPRAVPRRGDDATVSFGGSSAIRRDPGGARVPSAPVYRSPQARPDAGIGSRRDPGFRRAPESVTPSDAVRARPRSGQVAPPPSSFGRSERRAPSGPPPSSAAPASPGRRPQSGGSGQVARPRDGGRPSGGGAAGAPAAGRRRPGG
jgi:hypothetical protein